MYIKRHEANIASRKDDKPGDPAISLIDHNGEKVYVLTATLTEKIPSIGTIHEDTKGNLWISLDTVRMEDVQLAAQATDDAWEEARGYADMKELFNLSW